MEQLEIKQLFHRGQEAIGIYFSHNQELNLLVRSIAGVRWSKTNQCWWIPFSQKGLNEILQVFGGKIKIDASAAGFFRERTLIKIRSKETDTSAQKHLSRTKSSPGFREVEKVIYPKGSIHEVNAHVIPAMMETLKLKAYSKSTIRTYLGEMSPFLQVLGEIPADNLKPEHLRRYLVYCFEKLGLSENTLHSRMNALKFYYEQVLNRARFFCDIPRPKKQLMLPRFFNQHEIVSIIKSTGNLKHKIMLMLAYGAGLRVSEVIALKTMNIDTSRMTILIEQAKGKKDRMVRLSAVLVVLLREYMSKYSPDPRGYLFEGQEKGGPYSARTLQLVIAAAKKKAGILKPGSIHALRHSFATHLLDRGTDVTLIMKLLGHNDIKTTLRYLHVTNRDLAQVFSPLDDLPL